jgi:hypothetical protein
LKLLTGGAGLPEHLGRLYGAGPENAPTEGLSEIAENQPAAQTAAGWQLFGYDAETGRGVSGLGRCLSPN